MQNPRRADKELMKKNLILFAWVALLMGSVAHAGMFDSIQSGVYGTVKEAKDLKHTADPATVPANAQPATALADATRAPASSN